jgi:predicted nucleotidyltransferase
MMVSEVNKITEIKKVISNFLPESEVIMFGSRARGDNQINSDYDFLVVSKDPIDDHQRLHFQALIRKSLAKMCILADIIIQSRSDINAKSNLPGHIVRSAMKEGVYV